MPPSVTPLDETDQDLCPDEDGQVQADHEVGEIPLGPAMDLQSSPLVNRARDRASNREVRRRAAEEDRELIERAQRGDGAAFRQLVERHQRSAFSIAIGLVRDENDARELVQEAFLRVYRGLPSFKGGSSFFTWLYRIIMNLSIDLLRKPGRRDLELQENRTIDEDEELPLVSRIDGADPLDVMRRQEIASRIQAALEALPPYHRGVILMREVDGMSYEEIAQAMGVSKGTIMSRLFHARQKLQRALADCYAEEGPDGQADGVEEGS
ncbi:sigma-70 family RNA polymerase sigma factor [Chondromyces crocatus]|uniref:ECF family RNA polymerase sigma factor n=1 Tax=Chondromyces crocatus TaxID=52 RepID=A0A0K1ERB4_CHOCO|nr:sigma-70 family RNA polymerase sigma factor [Chondromyces crocatus]AKT43364.1 ECF family RNA polymerase sigma factor [Chondromyces crocatus]